jgi:hypothetical protein
MKKLFSRASTAIWKSSILDATQDIAILRSHIMIGRHHDENFTQTAEFVVGFDLTMSSQLSRGIRVSSQ